MEEEIIKSWDESDIRTRQYYCDTYNQYKAEEDKARKECEEQGMSWVAVNKYIRVNELDAYHRFIKKFKYTAYDFMRITDKEIHKSNVKDAHRLILNFIQRVKERIGTITDYSNLGTATSSSGTMLTGYICGTEGRVRIESILAGGYNIQRLHVRILIHEM